MSNVYMFKNFGHFMARRQKLKGGAYAPLLPAGNRVKAFLAIRPTGGSNETKFISQIENIIFLAKSKNDLRNIFLISEIRDPADMAGRSADIASK